MNENAQFRMLLSAIFAKFAIVLGIVMADVFEVRFRICDQLGVTRQVKINLCLLYHRSICTESNILTVKKMLSLGGPTLKRKKINVVYLDQVDL